MDEYFSHFQSTLLKTAHGYNFFVDWKKAVKYAKQHAIAFGLLNALTLLPDYNERKTVLREIFTEHPKTIQVIPSLIAVRDNSIEVAELAGQIIYSYFDFGKKEPEPNDIEDMVSFCERTGIIDLFGLIKDVYTYALGVEVGLDSNARKNRSGEAFKLLMRSLIDSEVQQLLIDGHPFSWKPEIELTTLNIGYPKQKKVDFVIYYDGNPVVICEVNIYHGPGSKPNEIVRSYTDMGDILKSLSKKFLWITDGPGWIKMWPQFAQGAKDLDYILNYEISMRKLRELLLSFVP